MKYLKILFGEHLNKNFENIQTLNYCYNNPNKAIKNIKDFIISYDDRLCFCMLKYFIASSNLLGYNYKENNYKNENEILLKDIKEDAIAIMKIKKSCDCGHISKNKDLLNLTKLDLINAFNQKTEKIEKLEKIDEWKCSKEKVENFYDIIININSILKVKTGWEIEMSEEGEKKYEQFRDKELIVIGVVGNMNNGKTFVLSKLSKIKLPSGTSINTKGISVKYPELANNENRKYILLDSAGLEAPILKSGEEKEDFDDLIEKNNKFKLKARDIIITESFLQNFIISNSNILLLVVDYLTTSEQKLINKIKEEIIKRKKEKKLFIIHNLKTHTKKEQVKKYINEVLLQSGTFELKAHEEVTAERTRIEGEHFTEKETKGIKVYHLLFAADYSEAREIYNNYTIQFIEKQYSDVFTKNKFDVIEQIKEQFVAISPKILKEKVEINDFISNEEAKENKIIGLNNNEKQITLKRCFVDELGFQIFKGSGFEPLYNFFKTDKYLEIRVEIPGNVDVKKVGRAEYIGDLTHIIQLLKRKKEINYLKIKMII